MAQPAELANRYQQLVQGLDASTPPFRAESAVFGSLGAQASGSSPATRGKASIASTLLVVTDLRLDGRGQLTRQLGLAPASGDAELILACWQRWGADCVDHLFGDFVFALWCTQTRELWLARDAFGQRPLFVRRLGSQLAFSSALRPLRMLDAGSQPDPIAIADHLLGLPGDLPRTAWHDIERVPAGHLCHFGAAGKFDRRQYFRLQPPAGTDGLSVAQWREGFRERFNSAISGRLSAAEPIAATVSGGLDSSAVVAIASRSLPGRGLHAYAARFPQTLSCDEGQYIDELRSLQGLQIHDLDASVASPLHTFVEVLPWMDEPVLLQNLHLWATIYQAAQADGMHIVLDGHDGDSALGRTAASESQAVANPRLLSRTLQHLRTWRNQLRPVQPVPPPRIPVLELLTPQFARTTQARERWQIFGVGRCEADAGGMRPRHAWQLTSGYASYATERLSSLAHKYAVDPRHPFYDIRLLGWCLALPADLKQRDGYSRWVLRAELEGMLPDSIRWRAGKTSLSAQFHRAFGTLDASLVASLLEPRNSALAEYVDLNKAQSLWRDYQGKPTGRASTLLWSVATLGVWLRDSQI